MKKENETKVLTKECISTALLVLLEEKPYEKITISEITEKAGVSRMAYYRNYKDKDDILITCIRDAETSFLNDIMEKSLPFKQMITEAGKFFLQSAGVLHVTNDLPVSKKALGEITSNIFKFWSRFSVDMKKSYTVIFNTGAVVSVFNEWVERGARESAEEIADIICSNVSDEIIEEYNRLISLNGSAH